MESNRSVVNFSLHYSLLFYTYVSIITFELSLIALLFVVVLGMSSFLSARTTALSLSLSVSLRLHICLPLEMFRWCVCVCRNSNRSHAHSIPSYRHIRLPVFAISESLRLFAFIIFQSKEVHKYQLNLSCHSIW